MPKSKQQVLDEFGAMLVAEVRDEACHSLQRIVSGVMRDKWSKSLYQEYSALDEASRKVLDHFLLVAVDATIIQFLHLFDSQSTIALKYTATDGTIRDMEQLSDGLVGEVHNKDGWFDRFSRFKDRIEPLK